MTQTIILNEINQPCQRAINSDIDWLCDSLGLTRGRDTERISPQVVKILLHRKTDAGITSETIAEELEIETQRVLYHLRSLIDAGLLIRQKRHIFMRQGSMTGAIFEMRRDADRIFENLLRVAKDIDEDLGLKNRYGTGGVKT